MLLKRKAVVTALAAAAAAGAQAQVSDGVVKIGVITDMSSLYSDLSGQGSVLAARMALRPDPSRRSRRPS